MIFYLLIFFLILLILLIQGTLAAVFPRYIIFPDLLLVFVLSFSFLWGKKKGLFIGFIGGLAQDVLFGPAIGLFALGKMAVACLAASASHEIFRDQVVGPMFVALIATFAHEAIVYFLSSLMLGIQVPVANIIKTILLPKAVFHFFMTIFIYPLLYKADRVNFFRPSLKR